MRRTLSVVTITACALLIEASAAWAGDPSKVGQHVEDIVTPNVKSFWKIGLLVGSVVFLFSRKFNYFAMFLAVAAVVGAIIYNPTGFGDTVSSLAHKVL